MTSLLRNAVDDLIQEHGADAVREFLKLAPRIIALIKAGKSRRITALLDEAHRSVDEMANRMRPANSGEGHE